MLIALGMLRQRSVLRAKPIRTVAKQPQTTAAPTPNKTSIVHAHMCTPLFSYIKLKTFREKENNTALMTTTLTPHTVYTAVRYIFSLSLIHCIMQSFLFLALFCLLFT